MPLFIERKAGKRFYEKLVALEPAAALAELSDAAVDTTRFVGAAAARSTPLLWACARAKGDKWAEWVALAEMLIARPGADVNARDAKNESALSLVGGTGHTDTIEKLIPALMSKGARDANALGRALAVSWTAVDLTAAILVPAVRALTALAADASILKLAAADRCKVFENALTNGFDAVGITLFKKGFRTAPYSAALRLAAAGGCAEFIKLLCMPTPLVPIDHVFDMGQTALHIACMHGRAAAALAMLECGATEFRFDSFKSTPMM